MGVLANVINLGDSDGVRVGVGPTPLPIMPTALTRSALVTARKRERTINCFHMWEMGNGRREGAARRDERHVLMAAPRRRTGNEIALPPPPTYSDSPGRQLIFPCPD